MFVAPTSETILAGALQIREIVASKNPFFIGRNGTIEVEVLFFWMLNRRGRSTEAYPARLREQIQQNAGVFPNTDESIDRWCESYMISLERMDGGAAFWYQAGAHLEKVVLDSGAPGAFRTPLRSLEPYYHERGARWTEVLEGKKVAVVSSFADTMRAQVSRHIWRGEQLGLLDIPGVEWSFIRTGYAPSLAQGRAGWPAGCPDWECAVKYAVHKVMDSGADVALIGCGALGMIIAGELRRQGVSAIVLGGAIQVLFGIKGKRWEQHSVISGFWNEAWEWPAENETPRAAAVVEGGCYW
jgi:hypothetical protein